MNCSETLTLAIGLKLAKIRCVAALLSAALLLSTGINSSAATYEVTNSAPRGTGSFIEAVQMANGNPGPDTIDIKVDVNGVTSGSCGLLGVGDPAHFYMATVTGDLVIEGNGHAIQGAGFWVAPDGRSNVPGTCPENDPSIQIVAEAPGFLRVETGDVTVKDLKLRKLSAIAEVRSGAGNFTLERIYGKEIFDFFSGCDRPAINVNLGTNPTARIIRIKDSTFEEAWNNGSVFPTAISSAPWNNAFIYTTDTGSVLEISGSRFINFSIPVIEWMGTTKMQNSRIEKCGLMHTSGNATIVNSVFQAEEAGQGRQDRIIASHGGAIMLEACSISAGTLDCDEISQGLTGPGLIIAQGGTIQLKASAVGVTFPFSGTDPLIREAAGGNVTATTDPNPNWIQPVNGQDAAALRTILNQPALLTDPPGLPATPQLANYLSAAVTPMLGTTGIPGKLINAVTGANTTNVLISPIDATTVTTDVFGNPRTDAGGTVRDIGAVQLNLAPTLNSTLIGDHTVALSWTRPHDPTSGPITGYAVFYTPFGGATSRVDVAGAEQTTLALTNLTNGTVYDFHVVAVNNVGDGPPSNLESATPYGPVQTPVLLTMPSNGVIQVTWSTPDSGGGVITGYNVMYRSVGSLFWEFVGFTTSTSVVLTGLVNNVTYEFGVIAFASGSRDSDIGVAESTPVNTGLLKARSWSGGLFHYQLLGLSSRSYAIEASTNLVATNAWVQIHPLVTLPANGMTNLIDAQGAFTRRFYRAILLP